jgi:hypothetical protein
MLDADAGCVRFRQRLIQQCTMVRTGRAARGGARAEMPACPAQAECPPATARQHLAQQIGQAAFQRRGVRQTRSRLPRWA